MESRPTRRARSRVEVALACSVCGARNYKTTRPRRDGVTPLKLSKFCKACGCHTEHVESR